MGHSLGKTIVAEEVESEGQYRFLAQQKCEAMQWHYFSKPLPSHDFEKFAYLRPLGRNQTYSSGTALLR